MTTNCQDQDGQVMELFEIQKSVIRDLEEQLEEERRTSQETMKKLIKDITRLTQENDKKNKVLEEIGQKSTPEEKAGAAMRYEITRLTTDNLDLRLQVEVIAIQLKKTQRQLIAAREKCLSGVKPTEAKKNCHKYMGMFEFAVGDEKEILRNLIYG